MTHFVLPVHHNKDKILLEGDIGDGDDDDDDDEVFALKGMEPGSDDDDEGYAHYEDEDEDAEIEEEKPAPKKKSKKGKKAKGKKTDEDDEEQEEEEEEGWGGGRGAYYASNADQLESDDEEGNALEEQEAKRLQNKMREELDDEDFGLEDNPELDQEDKFDTAYVLAHT